MPELLVPIVENPVLPRGGKSGESFSKSLHPAAFVVDGDKQRRLFQCMNGFAQPAQLLATVKIARKQYDAADAGMAQHISLDPVELRARDSRHEGAKGHERQRRPVTVAGSYAMARAELPWTDEFHDSTHTTSRAIIGANDTANRRPVS